MRKRAISLILSMLLIFALIPTTAFATGADDIKHDIVITNGTVSGKAGVFVEWKVTSFTEALTGANICFAYDSSIFELIDKDGNTVSIPEANAESLDVSTGRLDSIEGFDTVNTMNGCKDGSNILIAFEHGSVTSSVSCTESTLFDKCFLAYKEGKSTADVSVDKLKLCEDTEAKTLALPAVVYTTTTDANEYVFGSSDTDSCEDTEGWASNITFGKGFDFAKKIPTIETAPTASVTYGDAVADGVLTGGVAKDGETEVPGTFSWADTVTTYGDAGTKTLKAKFTPTDADTYAVVEDINVSVTVGAKTINDVAIAAIPDQEYTGSAITPEITVTGDGGKTLKKDIDYTVTYGTNTDIGDTSGSVTVKAKDGSNYTFSDVTKNFNIVAKAGTISISGDLSKTYDGDTVDPEAISVTKNNNAGVVTYKFYTNEACTEGETETPPSNAGSYWVKAFMAADNNFGAAVSNALAFEIRRADITPGVTISGWTFGEPAETPAVTGNTGNGTAEITYKLKTAADSEYTATAPTNAGEYTVRVTIPQTSNYNGGTATADFVIAKKEITDAMVAAVAAQTFTGAEIKPEPAVTDGGTALVKNTDFTYAYEKNTAVGTDAVVKVVGAGNYQGTVTKTFSINKAAALTFSKEVSVNHSNTEGQTVSLAKLMPANAGTLSYTKGAASGDDIIESWDVDAASGALSFALKSGTANEQTAALSVTIGSDNYENSTVTVTVTAVDKEVPVVSAEDITKTYTGDAVADSEIKGTATFNGTAVRGTWAFKGTPALTNVADSGSKEVTFTPENAEEYVAVDATITVTIEKATPTGEPAYTAITASGMTLADAGLGIGTILPAGGTIAWTLPTTEEVTANTEYDWLYTPTDQANYNNLTGKIKLWTASAGSGGIYVPTVSKPTVIVDGQGGKTILSADGKTLTILPEEGYEVASVKVNGQELGAVTEVKDLKATDKVEVTFTKKAEEPSAEEIAQQIAQVKQAKFTARSSLAKINGKKAVKVSWRAAESSVDFDGYDVFRSTKRYSGYGKKPFFTTKKTTYYNTAVKKGATYYYKIRAYKVIDGKKIYTDYSTKAWRTVK